MLAETKKKSSSWETTVKRFVDIGTDGKSVGESVGEPGRELVGASVLGTSSDDDLRYFRLFFDLFFRFLGSPALIEGNTNKVIAMKIRFVLVMNILLV